MSKISISDTFIYRHRYFLGYCLIAIGLLAVLIFAGLYSPGGLSDSEMKSVVISNSVKISDPSTLAIINLPYHVMQKASLMAFGVSILSIKLPSIILAFFSAIGIVLLLRRWFKPSIGVLASLIAISTGQFIFFAQDGTPGIMYIFWAVCLLLLSSLIIRQQKFKVFYVVAFYIAAALSLYTPLSVYAMAALTISIILHPHLRYLIRKLPKYKVLIGFIFAIIIVTPLFMSITLSPRLILQLLGAPDTWPNLVTNLRILGSQYFGFSKPGGSLLMTPFFELGSMLIVAIGAYQVVKDRFTSKNYVIIFWSLCIIVAIIINPQFTSVSFLPIVLLLASGLNSLLSHWYELFPLNPYARIAGLIPLIILVSVLVFSGADRYIFGYNYDPNIVPYFSKDLNIISDKIDNLVVSEQEYSFYSVVAKYNKDVQVSIAPNGNEFWATRLAKQPFSGYELNQIITSSNKNNSDRFYLYSHP